ncbi:DNA mismatch repair protein MutS [Candidatus Poribacteria bacterium]|nr:MAG: DNA mismatch repair protein MutS [Candidatus Poribacteria bacterium]
MRQRERGERREKLTLMRQYKRIKSQYPDAILFYRVGDFYETFYEDAKIASKVLGIALTSRDKDDETGEPVPLAGVPHHALETYLYRMVKAGYKVAICEQVEDPKKARGVVKREVVRVVTPGTLFELEALEHKENNYLVALCEHKGIYGLANVDLSTGEFSVTEIEEEDKLISEMLRLNPSELLIPEGFNPGLLERIEEELSPAVNRLPPWQFDPETARSELLNHFEVFSLEGFGCEGREAAISAAGALIQYLKETQKQKVQHILSLKFYSIQDYMLLDAETQRNLELIRSIRDGSTKGTLLEVLDETVTPMGGRRLRQIILRPLLNPDQINARLDAVQELYENMILRDEIRELLKEMRDIERLMAKVDLGSANARDLLALRDSLRVIPQLREKLEGCRSSLLQTLRDELVEVDDIVELIDRAIHEDPPATVKEGGIIKDGYNAELDELRAIVKDVKGWIARLQQKERERTGISSLKIGYNQVFGYYIEVTKANLHLVPPDYIRKQTLVNAERFITPELKEQEAKILNAQERINELEYELFCEVRNRIAESTGRIQRVAAAVAMLDVLANFAHVAAKNNYVRPQVDDGEEIIIRDGRHPVVEKLFTREGFVPNDTYLNCSDRQMYIITGPNMSGKCVAGDTLVFTDRGLVEIKELQPCPMRPDTFAPCWVIVTDGMTKKIADHFYYGGFSRTIKIKTRFGFELEGTPEHRIWVRNPDGTEGWKRLDEIKIGDVVAIPRGMELWGSETEIKSEADKLKGCKRYKLPKELSGDLAYLMGLLVGDGALTYENGFTISAADPAIAEEVRRITSEQFGYEARRKSNGVDLLVSSKQIRTFLRDLGLGYWRADSKRVPSSILRAPRHIVVSFLRGLFDADGYVDNRYGNIELLSASKKLARQVQMLLLNMGIVSSLGEKKVKGKVYYRLEITGENAILFHKEIGFKSPRKKARGKLSSGIRRPNIGIPHLENALELVRRRIVARENKSISLKKAKSISSIFHTYIPNRRNISYRKLVELVSYCLANGVECDELLELVERSYLYLEVVEVKEGYGEVYDLSVPDGHSFVANGFINHNSTYLRQVALICLMAQIGSFVPASSAKIGVVDRIFTRVGASDSLATGQSTFLVEMNETANILNNATRKSLIILDEIGRGTSTFDGISIAWAVAEYILKRIGAKTLFATHYHELTELAKSFKNVKNYNVAVLDDGERIVFLRKVVEGATDKSYGIHVAKLAGLPQEVIERAKRILEVLESHDISVEARRTAPRIRRPSRPLKADALQLTLFSPKPNPIIEELKKLDLDNMTPIQALNKLYELKLKAEKEGWRK